jgi:hypothetical protein
MRLGASAPGISSTSRTHALWTQNSPNAGRVYAPPGLTRWPASFWSSYARVDAVERRLPPDARATGVYPYPTGGRVRRRIVVARSDGTVTTRRGYPSYETARRARDRLADPRTDLTPDRPETWT